MRQGVRRGKALLLAFAMLVALCVPGMDVRAAGTEDAPYGDSLELNHEIKLNQKKTFTKTGKYYENTLYKKEKTAKVKYTISCKQKGVGDNYKVTYKVTYKYLGDPKIDASEVSYDDWYWGWVHPMAFFTVFDYQTGLSLEQKNDLGVKVKGSEWKSKYYPKQTFYCYAAEDETWFRNSKSDSVSFTVTYPKTCKDVCVGIGFSNMRDVFWQEHPNIKYMNGECPYGDTNYYKNGEVSYMRLNN